MNREYNCPTVSGKPKVAYRESISERCNFDYTHKKQSGGSGQFGRVIGYLQPAEVSVHTHTRTPILLSSSHHLIHPPRQIHTFSPMPWDSNIILYIFTPKGSTCSFKDETVGQNIPKTFIPSIEKGFLEACGKGPLSGHAIQGVEFVLTDGATHIVDSNDLSFRMAAIGGVRQAFLKGGPVILEPIMSVEVTAPEEYQACSFGDLPPTPTPNPL